MRQISSSTIFSIKGAQQFVRRARRIDVRTETHAIPRVLENSLNEKAHTFHEHHMFLPREDHKEGAPT